jgi:DNA-binding transcriptional regulator YhcF (GntR family)
MQIINQLKKDIITGKLSPREKLPSTRELAIKYSINPNTSARIYKEMEREDITYTKRGLGTFVTESTSRIEQIRNDVAQNLINDFIKGMTELGYTNEMLISIIQKESEEN